MATPDNPNDATLDDARMGERSAANLTSTDSRSSDESPLKSHLLPKVSFRALFGLTLLSSIVAAVARAAGEGSAMAFGVIAAIVFLLIVASTLVSIFFLSWAIALIWYTGAPEDPASPFAEDQLPPQILPPSNPLT